MNKEEFYSIIGRDIVEHVVNKVPTPAFIYFKKLIHKRHSDLRCCLPQSFQIYYAVKANPCSVVLQELSSLGCGADVASLGELKAAVANGIAADHIEFSGPGKSEEEIGEAIRQGISSINAESMPEIEIITQTSRQLGIKANVGIRINPRRSSNDTGINMSGDTQFGIPLTTISEALSLIRANPDTLSFTGLHIHSGSQILSNDALIKNFRMILDISLGTLDLGILPINKINFGGGWGISYFSHQTSLDLKQLTDELKELFNEAQYSKLSQMRFIVEPGRFLVGECGVYVTRVLYKKPGMKRPFLIVDGGMHQHYLLAGGMGQVIRRNFEIDIITTNVQANTTPMDCDIAGCLCTPQDILAQNLHYNREIFVNDRVLFFNSGAYGVSASPINFLGHKPPSEIIS